MGNFKDISGQKFGRLTALYKLHNAKGRTKWLCVCECGNLTYVDVYSLQSGNTKSCGCLHKELASKQLTTHGKSHSRLYTIYNLMKRRCYNVKDKRYKDYGARGIAVCDEWKDNFQAFYDWSMENGYNDNLTIDRVNNNGNYEPNNCRWTTRKQQARNTRRTKYITYKGVTRPLIEWCEVLGLNHHTIETRLYRGWSIEKAFEFKGYINNGYTLAK